MKTIEETPQKQCPKCGATNNQTRKRFNRSGTQRFQCYVCGSTYTLNPKKREYSEKIKKLAIKMYYSGVSGRGVGKVLKMIKFNVYNWIKKTKMIVDNSTDILEMDELYWFIKRKPRIKTRENVYLITLVSRSPRQIVGFDVAYDKSPEWIQTIVDKSEQASKYCTKGYLGYIDIIYPGEHVRNVRDKSNTYTVEGVNGDFRHYIPILARRSRCFARSLETFRAVLDVFIEEYNLFGIEKYKYRQTTITREIPFSVLDFLQERYCPLPPKLLS